MIDKALLLLSSMEMTYKKRERRSGIAKLRSDTERMEIGGF